jgi:Flp pilus assembly protein TadG
MTLLGNLRRLWSDRSGQFAMIFAIALPMLVLTSGLAVNYGMMTTTRQHLQSALDSGILAAVGDSTATTAERLTIANSFTHTNVRDPYGATGLVVNITHDTTLDQYDGVATVDLPVVFGEFFGRATTPIRVTASARYGVPAVEVMLVLDKTGSMNDIISGSSPAQSKIQELRTAATNLANQVMDGSKVKIGIVPFSEYVNIGMPLRNESGFDIPADSTSCSMQTVRVWDWGSPYNCTPQTGTCWNNTYDNEGQIISSTPYTCSWNQCQYPYTDVVQNVCNYQTWYGCVGSRQAPLNATDTQTTTPVPGVMNTLCGNSPITRLTLNKTTVLSGIAGLQAEGYTYIPAGLMMGWHALSWRPILPDGSDPATPLGAQTTRAIVLMTDGANTRSKDAGNAYHWWTDVNAANQLTRELCDNIKADGIDLYTVSFDAGTAVAAMLRDCATSPSMAYDAANAVQLNDAFVAIGESLSKLRLTR